MGGCRCLGIGVVNLDHYLLSRSCPSTFYMPLPYLVSTLVMMCARTPSTPPSIPGSDCRVAAIMTVISKTKFR